MGERAIELEFKNKNKNSGGKGCDALEKESERGRME